LTPPPAQGENAAMFAMTIIKRITKTTAAAGRPLVAAR
jgi:hypothetical protein